MASIVFKDPATGARGAARARRRERSSHVRVFDPVAGGDALLVPDIGSDVNALAVFKEPATGAPRLRALAKGRCASSIRFLAAALLVLDVGSMVYAMVVFQDLATGALRLACGSKGTEKWCASSTRSRAARRWSCSRGMHPMGEGFDSLHRPGDGRAAARERRRTTTCRSGTRRWAARRSRRSPRGTLMM